jgi:hypothetical protein
VFLVSCYASGVEAGLVLAMAGAEGRCPIDAPRHALRSPAGTSSPADKAAPSPGFKNTLTLSELVQLLVRRDTDAKERAHAALALQYLSLNADKVRRARPRP